MKFNNTIRAGLVSLLTGINLVGCSDYYYRTNREEEVTAVGGWTVTKGKTTILRDNGGFIHYEWHDHNNDGKLDEIYQIMVTRYGVLRHKMEPTVRDVRLFNSKLEEAEKYKRYFLERRE